MNLNCLIIDDEPLARAGIEDYVNEVSFLQLTASLASPIEALDLIEQKPIDLIFLDIQMPKLSGLEFLRTLPTPPLTIITTAYPSFALEGFRLEVIDYLVKPITFDRFLQSVQKARKQASLLANAQKNTPKKEYFFIKSDNKYEKIVLQDLLFVESMQNYVQIHTRKNKYTALIPLKQIISELPDAQFMQVHKSFIVALDKITRMEGHLLYIDDLKIPISRSKKDLMMNTLINKSLIKK